ALRIAGYVGDVAQVGLALADGDRQRAGFEDELAEIDRAAEFLAVAATVRVHRVEAEAQLVAALDGGERVVDLILPVDQQGGLRGAGGERAHARSEEHTSE